MAFNTVSRRLYSTGASKQGVYILSAARTPIGSFRGSLSKLTAPQLGSIAVKAAVERAGLKPHLVQEVIFGNVLSANVGQAPARQVAIGAGLPNSTVCLTINKVCASGLKATSLGAQSLLTSQASIVVAGGTESMSNVPFYIPRVHEYGHTQALDAIIKDGLWDVYNQIHMGSCAEETAEKHSITRADQDAHAAESYRRAAAAVKAGLFKDEIVPVTVPDKKQPKVISEDEEYSKVDFSKIPGLRPAFKSEGGTVTAANSSKINDGAAALVLATGQVVEEQGLKPIAQILSFADAECAPKDFTIAPSLAVPKALFNAGLKISDVDRFELNEAFSVVARVNEKILGLDPAKVNVRGGAVALGHPIGASGARILVTLIHQLEPGQIGVAGICNGGGGATAVVVKRV